MGTRTIGRIPASFTAVGWGVTAIAMLVRRLGERGDAFRCGSNLRDGGGPQFYPRGPAVRAVGGSTRRIAREQRKRLANVTDPLADDAAVDFIQFTTLDQLFDRVRPAWIVQRVDAGRIADMPTLGVEFLDAVELLALHPADCVECMRVSL